MLLHHFYKFPLSPSISLSTMRLKRVTQSRVRWRTVKLNSQTPQINGRMFGQTLLVAMSLTDRCVWIVSSCSRHQSSSPSVLAASSSNSSSEWKFATFFTDCHNHIYALHRQLVHMTMCCINILFTRERTIIGSVSYRNRYWLYRIESYRLLLYQPILRASLQVHQLLTDRITHDDQRAFERPVTRPPRARAVLWSMIRERVGGKGGGRRL